MTLSSEFQSHTTFWNASIKLNHQMIAIVPYLMVLLMMTGDGQASIN